MKKILLLSLILFISACASDAFIVSTGNMPVNERIEKVKQGDTKEFVENTLGSPSNISPLDENTWMYMSAKTKRVAFFKPEELSRDILIIKFKNNKVSSIEKEDMSGGRVVIIDEDKTQAVGDEPGMLQKAFGTLKPQIMN